MDIEMCVSFRISGFFGGEGVGRNIYPGVEFLGHMGVWEFYF